MRNDESPRLSAVVALPEPIAVGTTFGRREWPAHVTLASNFVVDAPRTAVERIVRDLCEDEQPLTIRFADEAMFGTNRDVAVQLVESDRILALHERLADVIEGMPGFAADDPAFWRRGYRPHMTHVSGVATPAGASLQLPYVAIAQLTASDATISAAITLQREPPALDPDLPIAATEIGLAEGEPIIVLPGGPCRDPEYLRSDLG